MTTFILIPGGWQGGWAYQRVTEMLTENGHRAIPVTLSGLGETHAPAANLDTHIGEVVNLVAAQEDEPVVVGHSYAGMVVSGVAEAMSSKIKALIYVDAYVPDSGNSMFALTSQAYRDLIIAGAQADGMNCNPPPGSDPRFRPHPMGSFLQSINLSGRWRNVPRKTYIGAHGWSGSPFIDLYKRLSFDPAWSTFALECGHGVARLEPEILTEILLAQA